LETNDEFIVASDSTISLNSSLANPLLCGEFIFVSQERLPWAWSKRYQKVVMPYKKINISITKNETGTY
jgi:hypothetical protein